MPPRDAVTDTGSMQPIPEAVTWAQRADEWARQPSGEEPGPGTDLRPSRWSDVAPTGRTTTHLPDGVGWRTETAEWRSTAEVSRWRQTTEWRSSSGTHGWRSTTEAWRTGDAPDPAGGWPVPERPAISGTAWTTPGEPDAPPRPGDTAAWSPSTPPSGVPWSPSGPVSSPGPGTPDPPAAGPASAAPAADPLRPAADPYRSADAPTWQQPAARDVPPWQQPAPADAPSWQRAAADPPSWQRAAPDPPSWQPPPPDPPSWQPPTPGPPSWQQPAADPPWQRAADPPSWQPPAPDPPAWQPPGPPGPAHGPPGPPPWSPPAAGDWSMDEPTRALGADGGWRTGAASESAGSTGLPGASTGLPGASAAAVPSWRDPGTTPPVAPDPAGRPPSWRAPDDRPTGRHTAPDETPSWRRPADPAGPAPDDTGRHYVREDDRARWRESAGWAAGLDEPTRRVGRRRAAEPDDPPAGGTGWAVRSAADDWSGYTDTGDLPPYRDPDERTGGGWTDGGGATPRSGAAAGSAYPPDDRPRSAAPDVRPRSGAAPDVRPRSGAAPDDRLRPVDPPVDGPPSVGRRRRDEAPPRRRDWEPVAGSWPDADVEPWPSLGGRPGQGRRGRYRDDRPDDAPPDEWVTERIDPDRGRGAWSAGTADDDPPGRRAAADPGDRPTGRPRRRAADDRDGYADGYADDGDGRPDDRDGYAGDDPGGDARPRRRAAWRDEVAGAAAAPPDDRPRGDRRPRDAGEDWRDELVDGPPPRRWGPGPDDRPRRPDLLEPADDRPGRRGGDPAGDRDGRYPDPDGDGRRGGPPADGYPRRPAWRDDPDAEGRRPGRREDPGPGADWREELGRDPGRREDPGPDADWRDDLRDGPRDDTRDDPRDGPPRRGGPPEPGDGPPYRDGPPARRGGDWRADLVDDGGRPANGYRAVGSATPGGPRRDGAEPDWRRDLVDPAEDETLGLRRAGRVAFDEPDPAGAGPAVDGGYRTQGGGTDGWRRELQAELGGAGPGRATGRAAPPDAPDAPGTARYRSGTGDWRRDLQPGPGADGGADPGPPRAQGTGVEFAPFRNPDAATASTTALTAPPGTVRQAPGREQLLVASDSATSLLDAPETSWSRRGAGATTGSYERRATGSMPALVAPQGDLLEPDDDEEYEEATGGPLAAVGYTVVWYGVPVVLFGLYMLFAGGDQRRPALSTLAGAAPQFGLSLALSMLVAVGLRWISGSWKSASVGLAAAVLGGGIATVLASAITGQSLS